MKPARSGTAPLTAAKRRPGRCTVPIRRAREFPPGSIQKKYRRQPGAADTVVPPLERTRMTLPS